MYRLYHIYVYSMNPINYLYIYRCSQRCLLQVAMITLHSSAPWLPVCLGSLVAFLLLTFSAVVAATLVQHAKLSERFVLGVSAWPGHRFRSHFFVLNGEFDGKQNHGILGKFEEIMAIHGIFFWGDLWSQGEFSRDGSSKNIMGISCFFVRWSSHTQAWINEDQLPMDIQTSNMDIRQPTG